MNKYFILFLSFSILLFSCKEKRVNTLKEKKLISDILSNDINFSYFSSKSKLSYNDDEQNISSTVVFKIKKDSIIWMSFTPLLGIEVARAMFTKDSVFVLNRLKKQYLKSNYSYLKNLYDVDLTFQIIQSVLLGNVLNASDKNTKLIDLESQIIINQTFNEIFVEQLIDKNIMRLSKIDITENKSNDKLNIEYSDFKQLNGVQFGHKTDVLIITEKQKKNINLEHNRVQLNDNKLSFPFSIPASYEKM